MKRINSGAGKKTAKAASSDIQEVFDEMHEMESFLKKKQLQNQVLKKLTETLTKGE